MLSVKHGEMLRGVYVRVQYCSFYKALIQPACAMATQVRRALSGQLVPLRSSRILHRLSVSDGAAMRVQSKSRDAVQVNQNSKKVIWCSKN